MHDTVLMLFNYFTLNSPAPNKTKPNSVQTFSRPGQPPFPITMHLKTMGNPQ